MYCFSTLNALDDWLIWLLFLFIAIAISLSTRNRKLCFTQRIVKIHSQNLLELPVLRGKLAWNILVVLPGDSSNLRAGASPFARQTVKPCRCWIYTPSLSLKLKDSNGALNYSRLKQENNWIAASKIRMSSCVFNKNRGCTQQFFADDKETQWERFFWGKTWWKWQPGFREDAGTIFWKSQIWLWR